MTSRTMTSTFAMLLLMLGGTAPASVKPCRDRDGRIVTCKKPRQPSPRCKDAAGRFVPCPPAAADPPHDGSTPR